MSASTQVRLANDIAAQFAYLDRDKAIAGIAAHLRDFWDPRMRAQLAAHVAAGGEGLDPLVVAAVTEG
ncbi:MAG: formate dehydrogenase subunit delta [Kineosporiaceae bacterium]